MEQLARRLGLLDAILIVIGIVIGSGIFLLPNVIARNLPSGPAIIAIWIISGVLSLFGAFAYAELGAMMPATGGQYVYLREAFGPACAFLCGWIFLLAEIPGGIAFLSVGFSIYLAQFIPLTSGARVLVSLALITVLSAVNYIGVRESAWTQRIFTLLKIVGLVLIIGIALLSKQTSPLADASVHTFSYTGIGVAMTACLMAYNGWSHLSFVAGEVTNPQRNVPRSLAWGMGAVIALYVGANIAYMHVMTVPEIAATERVGAAVAERVMGPIGARLLSAIVLVSIVGAINGCILTGARFPFAQARDGMFFSRFGTVHPRFRTPAFAIVVQALWTGVLIVSGSYESLFTYAILSAWVFYTLSVAAVWMLRRKAPHAPRPYRMWGYPYTLWLFLAVSIWFFADAIVNQPKASLIAVLLAAAGIPFYFFWSRKARIETPLPAKVQADS